MTIVDGKDGGKRKHPRTGRNTFSMSFSQEKIKEKDKKSKKKRDKFVRNVLK